jgi:hypothetical protein
MKQLSWIFPVLLLALAVAEATEPQGKSAAQISI